jgi:glycosyltransferase involved in cell wall biosynthesis
VRILFLCKRHPQQRDLLERPYGRYFHLPAQLAARGHEVHVALLSHRGLPAAEREHAGVAWFSADATRPLAYGRRVADRIRALAPDWIIGGSDTHFGILAARWGARHGVRVCIDAYDNFESYLPWAWPLHLAWRRALGRAQLVSAAGPQLLERLQRHARAARAVLVPMAADPAFQPLPRAVARQRLGLPAGRPLVGYCGSLFPGRGAETLLAAFALLRRQHPEALLVFSGRRRLAPPPEARHLGYLPDAEVPTFLASLDVACVTAVPDAFGSYACPAKLYEALACGVPVVASDVPPIRWILGADARLLARAGDAEALAARLAAQLSAPFVPPAPPGWDAAARTLEQALSGN